MDYPMDVCDDSWTWNFKKSILYTFIHQIIQESGWTNIIWEVKPVVTRFLHFKKVKDEKDHNEGLGWNLVEFPEKKDYEPSRWSYSLSSQISSNVRSRFFRNKRNLKVNLNRRILRKKEILSWKDEFWKMKLRFYLRYI